MKLLLILIFCLLLYESNAQTIFQKIITRATGIANNPNALYSSNIVYSNIDSSAIITAVTFSPNYLFCLFKVSSNGNLIWSKIIADTINNNLFNEAGLSTVITDSLGFIYLAGRSTANEHVLLKLSPEGNILWGRKFNDTLISVVRQVKLNKNQTEIYLTGRFSYDPNHIAQSKGFFMRIDTTGSLIWCRYYQMGVYDDEMPDVTEADNNTYLLTGASSAYSLNGADQKGLIIKTDSTGLPTVVKYFGQTSTSGFNKLQPLLNDETIVSFYSTDFTLPPSASPKSGLCLLDSSLNIVWSNLYFLGGNFTGSGSYLYKVSDSIITMESTNGIILLNTSGNVLNGFFTRAPSTYNNNGMLYPRNFVLIKQDDAYMIGNATKSNPDRTYIALDRIALSNNGQCIPGNITVNTVSVSIYLNDTNIVSGFLNPNFIPAFYQSYNSDLIEADSCFTTVSLAETVPLYSPHTVVYPNPFYSEFRIESDSEIEKIELFDLAGKMVDLLLTDIVNEFSFITVSARSVPQGFYLLKINYKFKPASLNRIIKM
ncbi:MAG: T9SS type A sorting domain-containing protein [Bacteroidia bacterium]|nr:T9SS type A sorting domain-containing protein [Bacteroidia bacterium]